MKKIISVGLDIGSSKIAVTIVSNDTGIIDILGVGKSISNGVRKGVIVDIEETISSISAALEEAERMCDATIGSVIVGINGSHIQSDTSRGVIAISKTDGEITESDAIRAIEAARAVPNQPNREVLHVLPRTFTVDGQEGITDPVGMSGIRLEVDANVISCSLSALKNIYRCVEQAGLSVSEVVAAPLADAKLLLTKQQKEIGVILINIGAGTTSYAVFEEGELIFSKVIPIGSGHITNDIAIGLRTGIDIAEAIKIKYGYASPAKVDEKEEIDLSKFDKNETSSASVKYIAEITEARLNEIFMLIKDDLRSINRDGMLPAGAVLTGGGSKMNGICELTKEILRLPTITGKSALELSGVVDNISDPVYSTSVGLAVWGLESGGTNQSRRIASTEIGNMLNKVKKIFKNFLP